MLRNDSKLFREAIDQVARDLVTADHRSGFSFIKTPLRYPGGASVVIRVGDSYPNYFVTDFGAGYDEAEMMGGSAVYSRNAPAIAESAGIGFDQHSFFVIKASRDQLPGAVVTVANCSQEAVGLTALRLAERRFGDDTEVLYRRLVSVFPRDRVAKDAEVVGRSNTKWHVATIVLGDSEQTIFEPVSNHHSSVFAATTKFNDISKIGNAPRRVAVVRKKAELNTFLAVLSENADVIEQDVPNDTLLRLASAA